MTRTSGDTRANQMLNEPVNRIIPKLAVPTISAMLISSIYNMADTFFVGRINTAASGAIGVVFSAMGIIQAIAFTIGMGSGTNMSRALGAGKKEEAAQFVSLAFFTAFLTGTALAILGQIVLDPLMYLLGATETIAPYARDYARYIFLAAPFMMSSLAMNNLLRFQGLTLYAMIGITTGGVLNMALDPLFIFGFGLGTAGASIATALSQFVSFCILLWMCQKKPEAISVSRRNFKPSLSMYGRILSNGLPSLGRQGIASVSTILLNHVAQPWGDPAIAAMSIVSRYIMFINSAVIGFGQGFQPVCAFCYGAGRYGRVKEAFLYCAKVATIILSVLAGASLLLSGQIVALFRDDPKVIEIGTVALRLQLLTMPLWGFYVMSNMMTQSIGLSARSTIISTARQGIFLIPMLAILPALFGLFGLQAAQPAADICAFILSILLVKPVLKQLERKNGEAGER